VHLEGFWTYVVLLVNDMVCELLPSPCIQREMFLFDLF